MLLSTIALRSKLNVAVFIQLFGSNDFPFIRVQFFFFFFSSITYDIRFSDNIYNAITV